MARYSYIETTIGDLEKAVKALRKYPAGSHDKVKIELVVRNSNEEKTDEVNFRQYGHRTVHFRQGAMEIKEN